MSQEREEAVRRRLQALAERVAGLSALPEGGGDLLERLEGAIDQIEVMFENAAAGGAAEADLPERWH